MWDLLHPKITELAKERFEGGFYADSVLVCLREVNTIIKEYVRARVNEELDGLTLLERAFSMRNPIILFADLENESGRNIQRGYKKIFEGIFLGIRNPKSHENLTPDKNKTIHLLFLASFMFLKLEEIGILNNE